MSDPLFTWCPLYHYSGTVCCTRGFCLDRPRVGEGTAGSGTDSHYGEERSRNIDSTL